MTDINGSNQFGLYNPNKGVPSHGIKSTGDGSKGSAPVENTEAATASTANIATNPQSPKTVLDFMGATSANTAQSLRTNGSVASSLQKFTGLYNSALDVMKQDGLDKTLSPKAMHEIAGKAVLKLQS